MHKRMLIDTTHAEETRVVVMNGDRLEDYDVETSTKKQIKGNIYLAKVIRVEPSLQAAFVDYGGNRHGFLAFSEIHPDYFQIPVADREKLLALQDEEARAEEAQHENEETSETPLENSADGDTDESAPRPEFVGGEHDTGDESAAARRMARFLRNYKIQEVIRRRQILLVQVTKEERGNKGAALTTYVSLAGRYCVLMPNALRGGGVSRKITSDSDRKRLRDIIAGLDLPRGMAMIVRTAGAQRPEPEITRDCEYLLQLWDDIRSHTLSSVAPTLVYEEASLIKRAIRDLFSKDIEDILIDGEPAWKNAREFMRLLMPQNVNKVKLWRDQAQSLFSRYHVEGHLDAIFSPTAQLKSGGYIVINQTEALVAIDVNSGRSTGQRNIEDTALRTNLEAAEEVARQLRLRDLAGLIVIDFIDMESRKHNHMVEKRLKDALRTDRARIQIGPISHFGLLEMSRQRLRPSIAEAVLSPCPHCQGTGYVRGTESAALHVLRAIDDEGMQQIAAEIAVKIAPGVALYILNNKRGWLGEIETRHQMHVVFQPDESLMPSEVRIERVRPQTQRAAAPQTTTPTAVTAEPVPEIAFAAEMHVEDENERGETGYPESEARDEGGRRRRRRRRRGNRRFDDQRDEFSTDAATTSEPDNTNVEPWAETTAEIAPPAETAIMPGRRRTRTHRVQRNDSSSNARQVEPRENEGGRHQERREPTTRNWTGPTPADPFGSGAFDIFDIIEQAEQERSTGTGRPRSQPVAASFVETSTVEESTESPNPGVPATEAVEKPTEKAETPRRRGRPRKEPVVVSEALEPAPEPIMAEDVTPVSEPTTAPEANADKPAPRRRGRPRKKPVAADISETTPETSVNALVEAPAAEKPKRARSTAAKTAKPRTRKTQDEKSVETSEAVVQPINVDDIAPAKPRTGWWKR